MNDAPSTQSLMRLSFIYHSSIWDPPVDKDFPIDPSTNIIQCSLTVHSRREFMSAYQGLHKSHENEHKCSSTDQTQIGDFSHFYTGQGQQRVPLVQMCKQDQSGSDIKSNFYSACSARVYLDTNPVNHEDFVKPGPVDKCEKSPI